MYYVIYSHSCDKSSIYYALPMPTKNKGYPIWLWGKMSPHSLDVFFLCISFLQKTCLMPVKLAFLFVLVLVDQPTTNWFGSKWRI
jgi:hypothetical protein